MEVSELLDKVENMLKERLLDLDLRDKWMLMGIQKILQDEDSLDEGLVLICMEEFEKVEAKY